MRLLKFYSAILPIALLFIVASGAWGVPCSAIGYGQLTGIPPVGTVTYIEFTDTVVPPLCVRTEDHINCGLGTDKGYDGKYFFFASCPGWSGMIVFAGLGAESGWSDYYFEGSTTYLDLGMIEFVPKDKPIAPAKPKARWLPKTKSILLSWKRLEKNVSYLIYRSMMSSGADNGRSNGEYYLVGMTETAFFIDRNIPGGQGNVSVWYLIIARYDDDLEPRRLSGHSEESDELIFPHP